MRYVIFFITLMKTPFSLSMEYIVHHPFHHGKTALLKIDDHHRNRGSLEYYNNDQRRWTKISTNNIVTHLKSESLIAFTFSYQGIQFHLPLSSDKQDCERQADCQTVYRFHDIPNLYYPPTFQ